MSNPLSESDFSPPQAIQTQPLLSSKDNAESNAGGEKTESFLGYLNDVQELVIREQADIREQLRGTEEPNVYFIYDKNTNEKLYHVQEDSKNWCQQQICGSTRSFTLRIFDKFKREIIQLRRPMAICDDSFLSCLSLTSGRDRVDVFVRNYKSLSFELNKIGWIGQGWSPMSPRFDVYDENDVQKYTIKGPLSIANLYQNKEFKIFQNCESGQLVGSIKNHWNGLCREITSDTDLFSLKFTEKIQDEKMKAILLGGLFLIDFKYFEGINWSPCVGCCCGCCCLCGTIGAIGSLL